MPPIKKYEQTFWYYGEQRQILWGHTIPKSHLDARGFKTEDEALAAYHAYLDKNPELKADSPVGLPKGTDVYVDFDSTIYHGPIGSSAAEMAPPKPIVVRTLQQLSAAGYKITLYSCRSNPAVIGSNDRANQLTTFMTQYCEKHKIPFDRVEPFKPHFGILIDDRAVNGKDWVEVRKALKMDEYVPSRDDPEILPYDFIGLR